MQTLTICCINQHLCDRIVTILRQMCIINNHTVSWQGSRSREQSVVPPEAANFSLEKRLPQAS